MEIDNRIYLEKFCKIDGISHVLICSDANWYKEGMSYVKPGQPPMDVSVRNFQGCPDSCGLCTKHLQHTCLPVIEITNLCDMDCPICLKNLPNIHHLSIEEYKNILSRLFECEKDIHVINLSGGEPTLHPEFGFFLKLSVEKNVMQTTVSTNGLRLLQDKKLRKLFKETDTIAALQFDGFSSKTYRIMRGKDYSLKKLKTIQLFEEEGIKFSLVATVMKGINDHEITDIVDFFFRSKALSLMFQTAAFTGKASFLATDGERITIPDIIKEIEKSNYVKKDDFNPLPCSHFSCFALSYYLNLGEGKYLSLKEFLGKEKYLEVIANRTLPGLEKEGYSMIKERIYEFWSADDSMKDNEIIMKKIRKILEGLNTSDFSPKEAFNLGTESMKAIFIHQFMDFYTLDLGRLIKCCNHYPQVDGRIIPMCAQNIFFQ
jgi:uncharacterized radical SAM superfamily Fe-S cluster-containing enzyme